MQEKLCRELENARELHALEMQQAVQQEQAIAAALSKEVETIKLVCELHVGVKSLALATCTVDCCRLLGKMQKKKSLYKPSWQMQRAGLWLQSGTDQKQNLRRRTTKTH